MLTRTGARVLALGVCLGCLLLPAQREQSASLATRYAHHAVRLSLVAARAQAVRVVTRLVSLELSLFGIPAVVTPDVDHVFDVLDQVVHRPP